MLRIAFSVRQSNDWTLARATTPASRIALASAAAKVSGVRRFGAGGRRDLGLDVEAHVIGAPLGRKREHVRQQRNACAVRGTLLREIRRVGGAGLKTADVVLPEFRERERTDRRAFGFEEFSVRSARVVRVEAPVMAYDQHAIPGHRDIKLERGHADRQRRVERRERVFGCQAPRAAVALQVKRLARRGGEQHDERQRPLHHAPSIPQPRNNPTTPCSSSAEEMTNISA
jgi:hypothetical protein